MKRLSRIFFVLIGSVALAFGIIGIFLPIIPTTPFFLLTFLMYAKGSGRLKEWFMSTKIYERHIKSYLLTRKMTVEFKVKSLLLVTMLFSLALILADALWIRILLSVILIAHYLFIGFIVKTLKKSEMEDILRKQDENERKTAVDQHNT